MMWRANSVRTLAAAMICLLLLANLWAAEVRTWSDKTGKFSIKGKFSKLENGIVFLDGEDGITRKVPLDKLSDADQKIAQQQAESADPFEVVAPAATDDNQRPTGRPAPKSSFGSTPEQPGSSTPASSAGPQVAGKVGTAKYLIPKVNQLKLIQFGRDTKPAAANAPNGFGQAAEVGEIKSDYQLKLKEIPVAEAVVPNKAIILPTGKDFSSSNDVFVVNSSSKRAVLAYTAGSFKDKKTYLALIDLTTGKVLSTISAPGVYKVLALHPDGNTIAVYGEQDYKPGPIEIWSLQGNAHKPISMWDAIPKDDTLGSRNASNVRAFTNACFLDDKRLLLLSDHGVAFVWEITTASLLLMCDADNWSRGQMAYSIEQGIMAVVAKDKVQLIDLNTYKILASIPTERTHSISGLAFSPSGKRLAVISSFQAEFHDLTTGKLLHTANDLRLHSDKLHWLSEDVILAGEIAFDINQKTVLWNYENIADVELVAGRTWFRLGAGHSDRSNQEVLLPLKLPHVAAYDARKKFQPPAPEYYVKPGDKFTIDVTDFDNPEEQKSAEVTIYDVMKKNGYVFDVAAPLVVKAYAKMSEPKEFRVRMNPPGPGIPFNRGQEQFQTHTYSSHLSGIQYVFQGKVIWSNGRGISFAPPTIWLEAGQTVDQALEKYRTPNYQVFKQPKLPDRVQSNVTEYKPGKSKLTAIGLQ